VPSKLLKCFLEEYCCFSVVVYVTEMWVQRRIKSGCGLKHSFIVFIFLTVHKQWRFLDGDDDPPGQKRVLLCVTGHIGCKCSNYTLVLCQKLQINIISRNCPHYPLLRWSNIEPPLCINLFKHSLYLILNTRKCMAKPSV